MRKRRVVAVAALSALLWAGLPVSPQARESNGTTAAKALVEQGEAAARAGAAADAIAAFRKAIDADPNFVEAHQRFIELTPTARDAVRRGGYAVTAAAGSTSDGRGSIRNAPCISGRSACSPPTPIRATRFSRKRWPSIPHSRARIFSSRRTPISAAMRARSSNT